LICLDLPADEDRTKRNNQSEASFRLAEGTRECAGGSGACRTLRATVLLEVHNRVI